MLGVDSTRKFTTNLRCTIEGGREEREESGLQV